MAIWRGLCGIQKCCVVSVYLQYCEVFSLKKLGEVCGIQKNHTEDSKKTMCHNLEIVRHRNTIIRRLCVSERIEQIRNASHKSETQT